MRQGKELRSFLKSELDPISDPIVLLFTLTGFLDPCFMGLEVHFECLEAHFTGLEAHLKSLDPYLESVDRPRKWTSTLKPLIRRINQHRKPIKRKNRKRKKKRVVL